MNELGEEVVRIVKRVCKDFEVEEDGEVWATLSDAIDEGDEIALDVSTEIGKGIILYLKRMGYSDPGEL